MKKILLLVMFWGTTASFACSCSSIGDFLETMDYLKDNMVIGQIIGHNDYFYQIRIDSVISGSFSSDTINLMTGDGATCWEVIRIYDRRKHYIFNLYEFSNDSIPYYGLPLCGTTSLQVNGNKFRGRISGGDDQIQEIMISDFLEIYEGKYPSKHYKLNDLSTNDTFELSGNGQRIGKWKIVGYKGHVTKKGEYNLEGKKTGKWTYYLTISQKTDGIYHYKREIKKVVHYEAGRLLEISKYYDNEGKELNSGNLKNGTGQLFEYFDSGELRGKYLYKNGVRDGKAEEYSDGDIEKGNYKNGQKNGTWEIFLNGKLYSKEIYEDGKKKDEIWEKE